MKEVLNKILSELTELKNGQARLETRMASLETRMDSLENRMVSLETRMDSQETRMDSLDSRQNDTFNVLKAVEEGLNVARADIEVIKETQYRFEGRLSRIEQNQVMMQDDIRYLFRRDLRHEEEIAQVKKAISS